MGGLEPERREKRAARGGDSSALTFVFFIVGSLFNLLALILLFMNIVNISRLLLSGAPVMMGPELLTPVGAFLAGMICYLIANSFD